MADGHEDVQQFDWRRWLSWTRLFGSFKVAVDPKKLLLAAGGVVTMALGWWVLATLFYLLYAGGPPRWDQYKEAYENDISQGWLRYKNALNSWNLMHMLAGPVPDSPAEAVPYGIGDFVNDPNSYEQAEAELKRLTELLDARYQPVELSEEKENNYRITAEIGGKQYAIRVTAEQGDTASIKAALEKKRTQDLLESYNSEKNQLVLSNQVVLKVVEPVKEWQPFSTVVLKSPSLKDLEKQVRAGRFGDRTEAVKTALLVLQYREANRYKPAGYLATWPWFEDRGPNQLRILTGVSLQTDNAAESPWGEGGFSAWLLTRQVPNLVEPLIKFLSPIRYLFHPDGDFWIRLYLLLVIVWTMLTWSFFGGAITRMAAVQFARPTDMIGIRSAIKFAKEKFLSFTGAQASPIGILALMTFLLFLYGIVEVVTFAVGDIVFGGLLFPLAILAGLIIAVTLIGLVGWPLMHATISTEGTDFFEGLSRSYSYVLQAPWRYAWTSLVALAYGMVLVFFVGLMGSLTIYLAKWGMSLAAINNLFDRDPSYLFAFAPTSYEWRDLLLRGSPHAVMQEVVRRSGVVESTLSIRPGFMWPQNYIGAILVAFWTWLGFAMVVGFGYSYFWTAATNIYFLLRHHIDDVEFDEVYLEEDELGFGGDYEYTPPEPTEPQREGTVALNVVETAPGQSAQTSPQGATTQQPASQGSSSSETDSIGESTQQASSTESGGQTEPSPSSPAGGDGQGTGEQPSSEQEQAPSDPHSQQDSGPGGLS